MAGSERVRPNPNFLSPQMSQQRHKTLKTTSISFFNALTGKACVTTYEQKQCRISRCCMMLKNQFAIERCYPCSHDVTSSDSREFVNHQSRRELSVLFLRQKGIDPPQNTKTRTIARVPISLVKKELRNRQGKRWRKSLHMTQTIKQSGGKKERAESGERPPKKAVKKRCAKKLLSSYTSSLLAVRETCLCSFASEREHTRGEEEEVCVLRAHEGRKRKKEKIFAQEGGESTNEFKVEGPV